MYIRFTREFWHSICQPFLIKRCILILKFLKWNLPCVVSSFIFKVLKWNACIVSGTGTQKLGFPFRLWWLSGLCFGKFHLSKSNSEMTFSTVAFSYCPAMQWTMFSEGPEPEENQIDYSDFLPLQSHGRKGESAPMMHWLSRVYNSHRALLPLMYLTGVTFSNIK